MKEFIEDILKEDYELDFAKIYDSSPLIQYLDSKMGAINGNAKTRRNLANIYAIYSILHYYQDEFYNKPDEYKKFTGYEYTQLFYFYRGLYGGNKLQNHALNSRVNGEFNNKVVGKTENPLIVIFNGKYAIHIDYLYVDGLDISKTAIRIIEEYIELLKLKDNSLIKNIKELQELKSVEEKKNKIAVLLDENAEARIFEIISYAILKNHYVQQKIYIGYSLEDLKEQYLTLYKTGRTNANDGGIDFVLRPLGRFYQVTEVTNYDKYLLDIDKVLHFPITFVIKTEDSQSDIIKELHKFIEKKSSGMVIVKERYEKAIEEIITINELKAWLMDLNDSSINDLLRDIDMYYKLEMNLLAE